MSNGTKSNGIRPEALAAGVAVTLGIAWLATRKGSKCKSLPGVWHEDGPLYMTQDAYDKAEGYMRRRIRDHIVVNASLDSAEIQVGAADNLEDCKHWGNSDKMSDNQKQVWKSIVDMYNRLHSEAEADHNAFVQSVSQS